MPSRSRSKRYALRTCGATLAFLVGSAAFSQQAWAAGPSGGQRAVAFAKHRLGVKYSYGGGTTSGPSYGVKQGKHTRGFDCSGLTTWAEAKAGFDWRRFDDSGQ